MNIPAIEPRGNSAEMFGLVEAALDPVASPVEIPVVRDDHFRVRFDGMIASMPEAAISSRTALLSYPLSAITPVAFIPSIIDPRVLRPSMPMAGIVTLFCADQ